MDFHLYIPFEAIFPDEEPKSIEEYLKGIKREDLIKVGTYIIAIDSTFSNPFVFLREFFSFESKNIGLEAEINLRKHINGIINSKQKIDSLTFPFTYINSSLAFFESVLSLEDNTDDNLPVEVIETNILKAYLTLNSYYQRKSRINTSYINSLDVELKGPCLLLKNQIESYDIINYKHEKLISTQIFKAISFFEFLELNPQCKTLLSQFYNYYEITCYRDYILNLLQFATKIDYTNKHKPIDIVIEETLVESINMYNRLVVDNNNQFEDNDFKRLREKPLVKVSNNTYRMIYPLFMIEQIYSGLFWRLNHINKLLKDDNKIKNFYDYKTYHFSEKYILHKLLKNIFGNRFIQLNGDELDKIYDGAPDYYVRNGKKVLLFESKDVNINAEIKQSGDFELIEKALKEKLYITEKGKGKAIIQLINNISKILRGSVDFDKQISQNNVKISPIIVVHNRIFNTLGINKLLNFWFRKEVDKLTEMGLNTSNINALILIDIDTLIYNEDYFSEKRLDFFDCIYKYSNIIEYKPRNYSKDKRMEKEEDSFFSFAEYLDNKADLLPIKRRLPKRIKPLINNIFN